MTRVPLRTVNVTRYVTPLREGGSLPAIVEADDHGMLDTVDQGMAAALTPDVMTAIVDLVPDTWLAEAGTRGDPARLRAAYTRHLLARAGLPRVFVKEAVRAR